MVWFTLCRRSSLFISDAFRLYNRRKKTSIPRIPKPAVSTTNTSSSSSSCSRIYHHFSRSSVLQNVLKNNQRCRSPFLDGAKRFYYVDANKVHHFKPRGFNNWIQERRNLMKLGFLGLLGLGFATPLYLSNLEMMPYTNRSHFMILSTSFEKKMTESWMKELREYFDGKIVPPLHPQSIRLQRILENIVASAPKDLKRSHQDEKSTTTKHRFKKRRPAKVADLEGFEWEIILINDPTINAFCCSGGKIFVHTGLLDHFKDDAELATIIGHEVGHAFARHVAEIISKDPWLGIRVAIWVFITEEEWTCTFIDVILDQFYQYFFIDNMLLSIMIGLFLQLPFSRKMEKEADYIGILLAAAAGYDPRLVPKVYEKLEEIGGSLPLEDYYSTHPSSKKRAELLSQPKVMEEALSLYKEKRKPEPEPTRTGFFSTIFA